MEANTESSIKTCFASIDRSRSTLYIQKNYTRTEPNFYYSLGRISIAVNEGYLNYHISQDCSYSFGWKVLLGLKKKTWLNAKKWEKSSPLANCDFRAAPTIRIGQAFLSYTGLCVKVLLTYMKNSIVICDMCLWSSYKCTG